MKKSLLYVIPPSGSFAGVERVTHEVANSIVDSYGSEFTVTVLSCSKFDEFDNLQINYNLVVAYINRLRKFVIYFKKFIKLNKFDLIIISQIEPLTLLCLISLPKSSKIVLWAHGNPHYERKNLKSRFLFVLFERFVVRRVSAIFVVAPSQSAYFQNIESLIP